MTLSAVQTTMTTAPVAGAPGQLYDSADKGNDIITAIASEAIPFGHFVTIGATGGAELPDSSGEVTQTLRGVAVLDPTKPTGEGGYAAGDPVQVLIAGRIWIQAETGQTVAGGAVPFVRFTATGNEILGSWRSDADTADAVEIEGAVMLHAATNGGMGVLLVGAPRP